MHWHADVRLPRVPGASEQTRRVKIVNANCVAGPDGADGQFKLLLITADDQRHVLTHSGLGDRPDRAHPGGHGPGLRCR